MLPVDNEQIETTDEGHRSRKEEEFATFLDNLGAGCTFPAESAKMAYNRRNKHREGGLVLGTQAQSTLFNIMGMSFIPM
jgi:hypothetical protein